jgi:hypothetical protein
MTATIDFKTKSSIVIPDLSLLYAGFTPVSCGAPTLNPVFNYRCPPAAGMTATLPFKTISGHIIPAKAGIRHFVFRNLYGFDILGKACPAVTRLFLGECDSPLRDILCVARVLACPFVLQSRGRPGGLPPTRVSLNLRVAG